MAIVAPISKWEKRRPLVLALICVFAAAWFAYDGWYGWPQADDAAYKKMQQPGVVDAAARKIALTWPGWHHTTPTQILAFDRLANREHFPMYHSVTDIRNQRWIVLGIGIAALLAVGWFFRVKNVRVQADDARLVLSDGTVIPWDRITVIDNVHWHDKGYVRITYTASDSQPKQTVLDGTLYENLPAVLQAMAEHCTHARMISPEPTSQPQ